METLYVRQEPLSGLWFVCTKEPCATHWPHLYRSADRATAESYALTIARSQPTKFQTEAQANRPALLPAVHARGFGGLEI